MMNNRTNEWLSHRLKLIWQTYFYDIPKVNEITIKFGRATRRQLGSISCKGPRRLFRRPGRFPKISIWLPQATTIIKISGSLRDISVPVYIIDAVIAHELVHYSHGFSSPHPQLFRYPHQGSIVTRELKKRGLEDILKLQKHWLKQNWRHH